MSTVIISIFASDSPQQPSNLSILSNRQFNQDGFLSEFFGLNENSMKLLYFFKSISPEFSLNLFWVQWGFSEGSVRVRIGKPHWTLSQPSLYPLWNVFDQWMNGIEIQKLLTWDELQKMKQNQEWVWFKVIIGFNATRYPPGDRDLSKGQNILAMCIKQDVN